MDEAAWGAAPAASIQAEIAARIAFATHQCDVPLIADLTLRNPGEVELAGLRLVLSASPAVVAERVWPIDRLAAGSELRIADRRVSIAGGLLADLSERMRADLTLKLLRGDDVLACETRLLVALARNEWGGAAHMPELLAAFVLPNDPAVQRLLKEASGILERSGRKSSIEGYQSKSRSRSWEIVEAIWAAVCAWRLTYAEPPASFETQGQKVRWPSDVERQGMATCLDTALLFAAAIEQAGLHPLVALTRGHAFCGAWLQPGRLPALTTDDSMELRKAAAANELVLFETTLATGERPLPFDKAVQNANRQLAEGREADFVYAIDIRQARGRQITPLPGEGDAEFAGSPGAPAAELEAAPPLGPPPELPGFDLGLEVAAAADTPEGRVDQWKRRLLDLTKRNRLLNLKTSITAIPIVCPDPSKLEDRLAAGRRIGVVPPLRRTGGVGEPDLEVYAQRTGDDAMERHAAEALARDQVVAAMAERDLENGLLQLYRKARSDLQEGGTNTLFLAFGMLRWKQAPDDSRSYRAPLLLVPVKLERRSAASKLNLVKHEDEPVFNLTLLEMLRQEFDISAPELAGELAKDGSGVDVRRVWTIMRQKVHDVPGFEVVEEVVLSTFSFAKYLMWKDLADRTEALKQNAFVRHLIETPREPYRNAATFLRPHELDARVDPAELFMPLNADSSQVVAVHASAQGGDFVLEGPPGTGKSETIGNIVAHNLGLGRRVLFVSEKMAALEVVHRRLKEKGLGDFCLELHSSKANKREVIAQLAHAWDLAGEKTAAEWQARAQELKRTRDELNALVDALHRPGPAGISPRQAIGRTARYGAAHRLRLDWGGDLRGDDRAATKERLLELTDLAKRLGQQYATLLPEDFASFGAIEHDAWSYAWQGKLAADAQEFLRRAPACGDAARGFAAALGLAVPSDRLSELQDLTALATLMPDAARFDLGCGLATDGHEVLAASAAALELLERYRAVRAGLSAPYPDDAIVSAPVEAWRARWTRAERAIWPFGAIARARCAKAIKAHFELTSAIAPQQDLAGLSELQELRKRMDTAAPTLVERTGWKGLDTDVEAFRAALAAARSLRAVTLRLAGHGRDLADLRATLRRIFVDGREMLGAGMPTAAAGARLATAMQALEPAHRAVCDGLALAEPARAGVMGMTKLAEAVLDRQPRLNAWCAWVDVKRRSAAAGLECLIAALEARTVPPERAGDEFTTAYCAWLAPRLIDSRPELHRFSALRHEDLIRTFRRLDAELAALASGYVRARLSEGIPRKDDKGAGREFGVLSNEIQKKMRHKPVRQLVAEMGGALLTLTPCLMMSPLSIAQFLSAEAMPFDLVVFDEASQITVWDAVGAVARGRNVVIVGDPKQMPPTSFFDRAPGGGGDDEDDALEDLESILDEALSARAPHRRLTGHYRSRHESLIAFSNHAYYENQLVTYPAPETRDSAVSLRKVDGVYGKGADRTNPIEARAVTAEILRRLRSPELSRLSLGVVTLNSEQQRLIDDLLDQARRADPELERFFGDAAEEPVFVKNLETVQGDQRDVILLSVGYGPTAPGARAMSMNFGPLNRQGGERRLNVAITRATTEVVVFASFDASMIDLTRSSAKAVRDLKHYLDFAERGPVALGEAVVSIGGADDYDSDFEFTVAEGLRRRGWTVRSQVGVSKFRIDLGVVHPDRPGSFLAGIECDGAAYHRSPTARDRDRVRHAVLENLGWSLLRIWSTDYFLDPGRVLDEVDGSLKALLARERKGSEEAEAASASAPEPQDPLEERAADDGGADRGGRSDDAFAEGADASAEFLAEAAAPFSDDCAASDASPAPPSVEIDAQRFYDPAYLEVIGRLGCAIVDEQGPMTFKHLSDQLARMHGFRRTGTEIGKRVRAAVQPLRTCSPAPDGHEILWPNGASPRALVPFRGLRLGGVDRVWAEVPHVERLGLARAVLLAGGGGDPAARMAERIGIGRLRGATRAELEKLLSEASDMAER